MTGSLAASSNPLDPYTFRLIQEETLGTSCSTKLHVAAESAPRFQKLFRDSNLYCPLHSPMSVDP